ncbi:MAG: hypothetical protein B7Y84_18020 [Azorhizobium sp. 32-67-21]|nr:MAG: hypothetical protein B7Y84_18020 [Azorhizobium sp. 32-67-21]
MGRNGSPIAWHGRWYHRMPSGHYRHARGKLLHREIYEVHKGPILDGMDVHHVDGNPGNNVPDNLEAMSRSDHTVTHAPKGIAVLSDVIVCGRCEVCGERTETNRLEPSRYCSHRCYMQKYRADKPATPLIPYVCERCGRAGEAPRKRRFCSRQCKNNYHVAAHERRKRAGLQS